jgi:hypothetical protein
MYDYLNNFSLYIDLMTIMGKKLDEIYEIMKNNYET